jgi:hypothetical protein
MHDRCACGTTGPQVIHLGCLECGTACCPACAVSLESATYCRPCAAALLETITVRAAGPFEM